jgi:hypothetical protein
LLLFGCKLFSAAQGALFEIAAKLRLAARLYACAVGGFAFGRGLLFDFGACSCAPEGAEFVIEAKLRLATLLYAYAAGGSFLVLARKEPKKPLLGLGICVAAIVRVRASGL